jgi:hypothetical protein
MPSLRIGDTVNCRVKDSIIVSPYMSYDEITSFVIVAVDEEGYYLYVPHYYTLKLTVRADNYLSRTLGIERRFLDESIVYISEAMVLSVVQREEGLYCGRCGEFARFAASNQEDGGFICFPCRQSPYK